MNKAACDILILVVVGLISMLFQILCKGLQMFAIAGEWRVAVLSVLCSKGSKVRLARGHLFLVILLLSGSAGSGMVPCSSRLLSQLSPLYCSSNIINE